MPSSLELNLTFDLSCFNYFVVNYKRIDQKVKRVRSGTVKVISLGKLALFCTRVWAV